MYWFREDAYLHIAKYNSHQEINDFLQYIPKKYFCNNLDQTMRNYGMIDIFADDFAKRTFMNVDHDHQVLLMLEFMRQVKEEKKVLSDHWNATYRPWVARLQQLTLEGFQVQGFNIQPGTGTSVLVWSGEEEPTQDENGDFLIPIGKYFVMRLNRADLYAESEYPLPIIYSLELQAKDHTCWFSKYGYQVELAEKNQKWLEEKHPRKHKELERLLAIEERIFSQLKQEMQVAGVTYQTTRMIKR